jgi:hypothetical protein
VTLGSIGVTVSRRPLFSIPFEDAPVGKPRMIRPQSLDALAGQTPDEASRHVEQFAGRPLQCRGLIAPGIEEPAAVIERPSPIDFRERGEKTLAARSGLTSAAERREADMAWRGDSR